MDYTQRYSHLSSVFRQGTDFYLSDTSIDVRFFPFESAYSSSCEVEPGNDPNIVENRRFEFPIFFPAGKDHFKNAILLLHGLNERSWDKYLTWAEYICKGTGKPVILFPIAFHINRSPSWWSKARQLILSMNSRRAAYPNDASLSFANIALSERISENPDRFYLSGKQTFHDLTLLTHTIKAGLFPYFSKNAHIDILAYSIGAFLSQILLMVNPENLFSYSRLFMFCGGSIFSSMSGVSKYIMDKPAYNRLYHYYIHIFGRDSSLKWIRDKGFHVFESMISPERNYKERTTFFSRSEGRIGGISLQKDTVIPYHGIREALGEAYADHHIQLIDFDFPYSHENPFPIQGKIHPEIVNAAFNLVFSQAVRFLA